MTNYRTYMKRLQNSLGESKAPDRIQEEQWWNIVMKELNVISKDCAKELEKEIGVPYQKLDHYLAYEEAPPMRIWALAIALTAWIGWVMNEKGGHPYSWQKIEEAYNYGKQLSIDKQTP
jgi:hypothetical protein